MDLTKLRQKTLVKAVAMKNASRDLVKYSQSYYDKIGAIADGFFTNGNINADARIEKWFMAAHSDEDAEKYQPTTEDIEAIALVNPTDKLPQIKSTDITAIEIDMPDKEVDKVIYSRKLKVTDWKVNTFAGQQMTTSVKVIHFTPEGIIAPALEKSCDLISDSDPLPPPYDKAVPNEFAYIVGRILGGNENIVSVMTEMLGMAIPVVEYKISYV